MAGIETPEKSYTRSFGDVCRLCSENGRLQQKIFSKSGEKKQIWEKICKTTGLRHMPYAANAIEWSKLL